MELKLKNNSVVITEEEEMYLKTCFNAGITDPASLVSLLYSRGKDAPYTKLKATVQKVLGIVDIYKSISSSNLELNEKHNKSDDLL